MRWSQAWAPAGVVRLARAGEVARRDARADGREPAVESAGRDGAVRLGVEPPDHLEDRDAEHVAAAGAGAAPDDACARACICVRACVRACASACVRARAGVSVFVCVGARERLHVCLRLASLCAYMHLYA